jgi:hypothetical protein
MLYSEIIAVCSEINTKHINSLCVLNVELLNVKHHGTYINHLALKILFVPVSKQTPSRLLKPII